MLKSGISAPGKKAGRIFLLKAGLMKNKSSSREEFFSSFEKRLSLRKKDPPSFSARKRSKKRRGDPGPPARQAICASGTQAVWKHTWVKAIWLRRVPFRLPAHLPYGALAQRVQRGVGNGAFFA